MGEQRETRDSIEALARLAAALDDPFADRSALLEAAQLDESALQRRLADFAKTVAADPSAARPFAVAFGAAKFGTAPEPDEPEASVDETMIAAPRVAFDRVLPFKAGHFVPEARIVEPQPARPAFDVDATLPPVPSTDETLPFVLPTEPLRKKKDA